VINLKFARPSGIPMMVKHKTMPVMMCRSARYQPSHTNQMMFPTSRTCRAYLPVVSGRRTGRGSNPSRSPSEKNPGLGESSGSSRERKEPLAACSHDLVVPKLDDRFAAEDHYTKREPSGVWPDPDHGAGEPLHKARDNLQLVTNLPFSIGKNRWLVGPLKASRFVRFGH
jgi:hypothetical protein